MYERDLVSAADDGRCSSLTPLIRAADGLTLCQVCSLTGLEPSTVQNWIKRGFVPHPERKRYGERHVARIMLIDALRECLLIERVGELMRLINGNADDTADDTISEVELYELFNSAVTEALDSRTPPDGLGERITAIVNSAVSDSTAREKIIPALTVMVSARIAGVYKREADRLYTEIINKKLHAQREDNNG